MDICVLGCDSHVRKGVVAFFVGLGRLKIASVIRIVARCKKGSQCMGLTKSPGLEVNLVGCLATDPLLSCRIVKDGHHFM